VTAPELAGLVGGSVSLSGGGRFARETVTVAPDRWRAAVTAARDTFGYDFFDWLTAVDSLGSAQYRSEAAGLAGARSSPELGDGYAVVAHLWSTAGRSGLLLRTVVPRDTPRCESIVDIYAGADWPEREAYEMFGVEFTGHPNLVPLLLPEEFDGHPLRKDFVLASRVARPWPGTVEPGESHVDGVARRAPLRPPGVPGPDEWGPA
jgi:NADH-quinone oxidoreductase subunit C